MKMEPFLEEETKEKLAPLRWQQKSVKIYFKANLFAFGLIYNSFCIGM